MNLVKNQNHGVILMKCSLFIDEIKIHQCFCPFHHTKCHFFGVFRIKNIMFDDVLVPWVRTSTREVQIFLVLIILLKMGTVHTPNVFSSSSQLSPKKKTYYLLDDRVQRLVETIVTSISGSI